MNATYYWVRCHSCSKTSFEWEPLYRCRVCAQGFTQSHSSDGTSNHCPSCLEASPQISEFGCPNCGQGELETPIYVCGECRKTYATRDPAERCCKRRKWVQVGAVLIGIIGIFFVIALVSDLAKGRGFLWEQGAEKARMPSFTEGQAIAAVKAWLSGRVSDGGGNCLTLIDKRVVSQGGRVVVHETSWVADPEGSGWWRVMANTLLGWSTWSVHEKKGIVKSRDFPSFGC